MPQSDDKVILSYASPHGAQGPYGNVRFAFLIWQILLGLAMPLGLLVGVAGTWAALGSLRLESGFLWNTSSVEDWIGFILWMINAPVITLYPWLGIALIGTVRWRLKNADVRGFSLAYRLISWGFWGAASLALGLLFALGKALLHGRNDEVIWWILLLAAVGAYTVGLVGTQRLSRRSSPAGTGLVSQ